MLQRPIGLESLAIRELDGLLRTLCLRCLTTQREFGPPGRIWFNLSWLGAAAGDVGDVETGEVSTKNDLF